MSSATETNPDILSTPNPMNLNQLTATCHCKRTTLTIPAAPTKLNECRCTVCYQYGALWAYYPRNQVTVTADEPGLKSYVREDEHGSGDIGFYTCGHCGVLTHWWGQQGVEKRGGDSAKMGVNARILGEEIVESCERKIGRK